MVAPRTTELRIPPQSQSVAAARHFVAEVASSADWFDEDRLDDLRLVVSETVTNALRAHVSGHIDEFIDVVTNLYPDRLEISVADSAGGFDLEAAMSQSGPTDLHRERGFGLGLIDELSDEAHFDISRTGTVVRLVIYRDPPT